MAFFLSFGLKVLFPLHAPLGGLKGGVLFLLPHREGAGKEIIRQLFFVECVEDNFSWDFKIFLWLSDVEMYSSINCDRDGNWDCRRILNIGSFISALMRVMFLPNNNVSMLLGKNGKRC